MENNKYTIYQNDLKYKDNRNINFNDVDLTKNNVINKIHINHDSIDYRYKECAEHQYFSLDFTSIKLTIMPILTNNFLNIKCLFLANNELKNSLDLFYLKNLISIDIDNNKLNNILLPNSIEEISCQNNLFESINYYPNLKRLKISNNKIKSLPQYPRLEILEANNNLLTELGQYENLHRLIIYSNPLKKIYFNNKLKYADISETQIVEINKCDNLEHLVANYCLNLNKLPVIDSIKSLELMGTKLNKLYFYKNFEIIIFQINLIQNISSKYKEINANFQLRNNTMLCISKGEFEIKFELQ